MVAFLESWCATELMKLSDLVKGLGLVLAATYLLVFGALLRSHDGRNPHNGWKHLSPLSGWGRAASVAGQPGIRVIHHHSDAPPVHWSFLSRLEGRTTDIKHIVESGLLRKSTVSTKYVIQEGGTLYALQNCYPCGKLLDMCDASEVAPVRSSLVREYTIKGAFNCSHAQESVLRHFDGFRFAETGLLLDEAGVVYFVHGHNVKRVLSCMDCGPIYGNVCEKFPWIYGDNRVPKIVLSRIGRWPEPKPGRLVTDTPPPFRCHVDVPDMIQPPPSKRWLVIYPYHLHDLALKISSDLITHGFQVGMSEVLPESYGKHDFYVLLGATEFNFDKWPPAKQRIVGQLKEKSSSWLRDAAYLKMLNESYAVFERYFENIEYLLDKGFTKRLWYAPMGELDIPGDSSAVVATWEGDQSQFLFNFNRMLHGMEVLPITSLEEVSRYWKGNISTSVAEPMILSMPESPKRRDLFTSHTEVPVGPFFDGVRHLYRGTWMATAMGYSMMAGLILDSGLKQASIAEDDVVFPPDYLQKIDIVQEYLDTVDHHNHWDIFSGLIADVGDDVEILSVETFKGIKFVTINKMTSMLFNIYNTRALKLLTNWNPIDEDVNLNTIDRYLEAQSDMRIIVTLPYLVGHREEALSTLWGIQNSGYTSLISKTEMKLTKLVEEFMHGGKSWK